MKSNRLSEPKTEALNTLEDYKTEFPDNTHIENRYKSNINDLGPDYLEEFRKVNPYSVAEDEE